ncbi:MAG TPA: oxidoreductase [Anaerolineaceae bacterium]|nr:oxidoreductase [Anaerolineaceae bacterium]
MKTFLILGGGTGGTIMANKLVKRLDPQEWKIVIVDKSEIHYYQPGFLFIPFGMYKPEDVVERKKSYLPSSVQFIQSEIEKITPEENEVTLKGGQVLHYDTLLIASGTDIHPEEIEGMLDGGWYQNIFDFYTFEGTTKLAKFLEKFNGGRVVINVAEMPIKCPVAPLEFAFLADDYFVRRGIRSKVELVYATPLPGAFTKPRSSAALGSMLDQKGIHLEPDFAISGVDSSRNVLSSFDGRELNYDLLVTIPTNMGADFIGKSGLGDDLNFVPTNKATLQSSKWENIWVIGDAANVPASKAGAVTHFESDTLIENIVHQLKGEPLEETFDGHANCYIESGHGKALLIDFNYNTEPLPGTYPLPVVGPFSLLKESTINHWGKLAFKWMYWNLIVKGRPMPVSTQMSMVGKKP